MSLVQTIKDVSAKAIEDLFQISLPANDIAVNETKPEFEGDYTVVLFALVKQLRQSPEALGKQVGDYLVQNNSELFTAYNVIKGFLNLSISDNYFNKFLSKNYTNQEIGKPEKQNKRIVVEYSSPNTNKPLHLGHLRNIFLGWSVAEILKFNGNEVAKTCVVNDRGVHICKSMIAWEEFANGATPESTGTKGDHFVGDYYVKCENQIKAESEVLTTNVREGNYNGISEPNQQKLIELQELMNAIIGDSDKDKEKLSKLKADFKEIIRASTPVMQKAQQMLIDWEKGKPEVIDLWRKMNSWVYKGFDETYR